MDLPVIVSGPILRRVDRHNVYIWVATSRRFQIGAELFRIHQENPDHSYTYSLLSDQSETESIRFGEHLYIYMIKLKPVSGIFPVEVLLGYNLLFTGESETVDLGHFGLLTPGDDSIVYGSLKYPSFFIHEEGEQAKVLYGSCRKFHGKGDDALASADLLLEETYPNVMNRPHSLFLLGDQIYADDVADPLFPLITSIGQQLVGTRERLDRIDKRLKKKPFRQSIHQIHGRKFIMDHFCQFTSAQSHNHLMSFSEYAAMYMLSWGPQLWEYIQEKGGLPAFEDELANENIHFAFPPENRFRKERQMERRQHEARFAEQSEDLRQSLAVLKRVRRLLANIPVYMIFDDHDITDDWNLSGEWKENVENSPLGRHVVANGLGAYWAFQGWGNDPEIFDGTFREKIKGYVHTFDVMTASYREWLHCLTTYSSWHFVAPTEPKTLFLDTRTKRTYDFSPKPAKTGRIVHETIQSPQLISQEAWQSVSASLLESGWKTGEALTIVSPTPLYGLGLIESVMHSYVYPLRAVGIPVHQLFDFEAWKYNGKGFSTFLHWIFEWLPRHCFILSGDVHYASSVKSTVQSRNGAAAEIVQFTSSPMHNGSFSGVWGNLMKSVSWVNSLKRKKKEINRFCDAAYNIIHQDRQSPCPETCHWKETLAYLSTNKGSIIETENNLGMLIISAESVQNTLLTYKVFEKNEISFNRVDLS
ncbi:hypothetical protein [Bacillus sp. 37MA]|uniref:hypothetical protein n=1 Tax=Bacillus sp. 37MA TaxID=1132442 RepID=UPI000366C907|nr:hypothetical protein [Bacillus sp. 37MA]